MTLPDPRNLTLSEVCGSVAELGLIATLALAAYTAGFFNGYNTTAVFFFWPVWLEPALLLALGLMIAGTAGEVLINYREQEGI